MRPPSQQTGLIAPVPELDGFVDYWRPRVETMPPRGVSAHITVMYPFLQPAACTTDDKRIADLVATHAPFVFELSNVGWFGDDVVTKRIVHNTD